MSFFDTYSERSLDSVDQNAEFVASGYVGGLSTESFRSPSEVRSHAAAKVPNGESEVFTKASSTTRASSLESRYFVFSGKATDRNSESGRNQLRIGNTVYDTLVNGISSIRDQEDFRGIMKIKHRDGDSECYIVFALCYSVTGRSYYLTSLGQYSDRSYKDDLKRYSDNAASRKNLHITLSPICRRELANLKEKLLQTNITRASVCLMQETISAG